MLLQSCIHIPLTVPFHLLKVPNSFIAAFWPSVYPCLNISYILNEKLPNICHMQREAVNSVVFESFYRNTEKQKLTRKSYLHSNSSSTARSKRENRPPVRRIP